MKPARLLAPRSVAVVGASTRPGSYGNQAVANLVSAGFPGPIFGVHPTADEVHGVPCVPRISDLPLAPDALVIATPAASVPALVAEAGAFGCGGAVVLAAGFAEIAEGRPLQDELARQARLHRLPICGPNGNGIVSVVNRAPLWGDAYTARRPGPVALISQSGNVAVNALLSTRALGLHTVISCGNQAVLDAADYLTALARLDGVRSVALYLEDEGDGHRLATALADCADHGIGLAVLKAGTSPLGASAAAAHTGSITGDSRVLRALIEEAGGAWAHNPHELLELAKTLATPRQPHFSPTTPAGAPALTGSGGTAIPPPAHPFVSPGLRPSPPSPWLPTRNDSHHPVVLPPTPPFDFPRALPGPANAVASTISGAVEDKRDPHAEHHERIKAAGAGGARAGSKGLVGGRTTGPSNASSSEAGGAGRSPDRTKGWVGGSTTATNVGVLVVTCSGGDAATAADEAERLGVWLPQLGAATVEALGEVLPSTATAGNPLDYTAVIFGETERTADLITVGARDDAIGPVLVYYDRPARMSEDAAESWDGALDGVILAASRLDQPVIVASTLPELMPEETAERLAEHGIVAVAGFSEGILCAGALTVPPPDAARLRSIAATMSAVKPKPTATVSSGLTSTAGNRGGVLESPAQTHEGSDEASDHSGWVAEHEAKEMLAGRGLVVPRGRVVRDVDDAMRVAGELGGPVALKVSSPFIQHKSDISALVLGVAGDAVREAYGRVDGLGGVVLVEEMVPPGVEVLIAVRRDGVVPVLVVALGGVWVEIFDDVVLIPLPADAARVEQAVRRLRAAPLLVGGRGRPAGDIRALAEVAATVGAMALEEGLDLVELNPVFVHPDGVTVIDAVIRRGT